MPQNDIQRINALEQRVQKLENNSGASSAINRYLPTLDKRVIEDTIFDSVTNIVWDKYIYHSSVFESIDRYYTPATGASQSVDLNGIYLETTAANGNTTSFVLQVNSQKVIQTNKETRFRTVIRVGQVGDLSNVTTQITTVDSSAGYVGFNTTNSTINGETNDGSTSTNVAIGTLTDNTWVKLELHYFPGNKTVFKVDDIEKGQSVTNLPSPYTSTNINLFTCSITNTAAAAHSLNVEYFEILQKR